MQEISELQEWGEGSSGRSCRARAAFLPERIDWHQPRGTSLINERRGYLALAELFLWFS